MSHAAEGVDCVVIGAGVVGLAVARALALAGREVLVLEACNAIGTQTSSRNSEVVHAGIYYAAGSLKAELCVKGRALLYGYCEERSLPHKRCGKLIVATHDAQVPELDAIRLRAAANGVHDLVLLDAAQARAMEPDLRCVAALYSPSTGLVDSHALMLSLLGDVENAGGVLALNSPVALANIAQGAIELVANDRDQRGWCDRTVARDTVSGLGLQACAHRVFRQGQLLQPVRAQPVFAPDLPRARGRWLGCAFNVRHGRSGTLWPRCRVGQQS
jgi:L-2-hydroxyglutarate oxidase LhgO